MEEPHLNLGAHSSTDMVIGQTPDQDSFFTKFASNLAFHPPGGNFDNGDTRYSPQKEPP